MQIELLQDPVNIDTLETSKVDYRQILDGLRLYSDFLLMRTIRRGEIEDEKLRDEILKFCNVSYEDWNLYRKTYDIIYESLDLNTVS